LAKLLNRDVHQIREAKKRACATDFFADAARKPDFATEFMKGNNPSFTPAMINNMVVDQSTICFAFDYRVPQIILACSLRVDLCVPWSEARPLLDPNIDRRAPTSPEETYQQSPHEDVNCVGKWLRFRRTQRARPMASS
jgi:hypothetical protein